MKNAVQIIIKSSVSTFTMTSDISLYGKCRCCLTVGEHRDVMKEYFIKETREVYFDMFLECFNVFLSTLNGASNLICTECIQRLRDANTFRIMVVNAEKELQAACEGNEFVAVNENPSGYREIKQELVTNVKEETDDAQNFTEVEQKDYDASSKISEDSCRLEIDEAKLIDRFSPESLRVLPNRNTMYDVCPKYAMQLDMLRGKKIRAKEIEALLYRDSDCDESKPNVILKKRFISEKHALVTNCAAILENSNVTAFKGKSRSGLPCFYCKDILDNIDKLREHQKGHSKVDIRKSLSKHSADCMIVNVDITDLKCTICDVTINNLKELKTHLVSIHKKKIYTEFEDRVIPFKIPMDNNLYCQICGFKYETFGSIERHMNGHYRNYICDECGTGFVTNHRMKIHIKTMHAEGIFPCELCDKVFTTHQKHKGHVDTVHKLIKRFKCPKCSERFTDYFKRHRHLVAKHGVPELEYRCNVCDKVYARRYMLSRHMKRVHLEERYFRCDICFNSFFAKKDLESHMVKHNGARVFECSVCKKAYARKKTLTEHMRIHNNDMRFSCSVCGQAFVQNCSLKGHVKTHHPELLGYGDGKER